MTENKYDVDEGQWDRWSETQRKAFNEIYEMLKENQDIMKHTDAALIVEEHWDVIAWNAAFTAAGEVS